MFLNYNRYTDTISVQEFRNNGALGDWEDVVNAVSNGDLTVNAPLSDDLAEELSTLESGDYWNGSDAKPEAIERVHAALISHIESRAA